MKDKSLSFNARIKSFKYAIQGIVDLFHSEPNAKIHLIAAAIVIIGGVYFQVTSNDWLWLILAIFLVIILEALNTAIETLVDLVQPSFHPIAGKVKDIMAAAVLLGSIFAMIVAAFIFYPRFVLCLA